MKRAILLLCLAVFASSAFAGDGTIRKAKNPVKDRYIALLDPAFPASQHADAVASAGGAHRIHTYDAVLNGFAFSANEHAAAAISRNPAVLEVHEDAYASGAITQYGASLGLDRVDEIRALYNDGQYTYTYAGSGVRVYIIDSGMGQNLAEFSGRLVEQRNFYTVNNFRDPNNYVDCVEPRGHGTQVASIAAGTTYGVAKLAEIANIRVLGCDNKGPWGDIIAGINHVKLQKQLNPSRKMVANISIAGDYYPSADQAVRDLLAAGVPVAIAAGNTGQDPNTFGDANLVSPGRIGASTLGVITAAAITSADYVTLYSSHGPTIDLWAPTETQALSRFGTQAVFTGTSGSAPFVAGVLAKHWETYPTMTPQQLEDHIILNSQPGVQNLPAGSPDRMLWSNSAKRRACCSF